MKDNIRIQKRAKIKPIVARGSKRRLIWHGHIWRRDPEYTTIMVLDKGIRGTRPRGRLRIRWMDNIRRDVKTYGIDDQITEDRKAWSKMVATVDTR